MKIKNVYISNYRSYDEKGISIPMSNITGLIGPNSAGKSNVLKAIDIFFHSAKLSKTDFHMENVDIPITIEITFSDYEKQDSFEELILTNNDEFVLRRIYRWNEDKEQGEPEKNLFPGYMWCYKGDVEILNPFSKKKFEQKDLEEFICQEQYKNLKNIINKEIKKVGELDKTIKEEYWKTIFENKAEWDLNYKWSRIEDLEELPKDILKFINDFSSELPNYIYLSIEHSVSDEFAVKKDSRLKNILSRLMELNEKEKNEKKKSEDEIRRAIDKYYSDFYDKKINLLNSKMNKTTINWDFSDSLLKFEREIQEIETMLEPSLYLAADDGFMSRIEMKGNGAQRLAIFQFLQVYTEMMEEKKGENIIFAIEEPELYLHPAYRKALYKLFRQLTKTFQIFYTTHDPIFVRLEYFDEIRVIRKNEFQKSYINFVDWEAFEQKALVCNLFKNKKTNESKRMELYNKCHGEQNEGFFADKIILVEGNTEMFALPIYFEKFNFNLDEKNICMIHLGGVESLIATYIIFTLFKIPVYIICDGDKPKKHNEYEFFLKVKEIGKAKYKNFIEALQQYTNRKTEKNFEKLKKNSKNIVKDEWLEALSTKNRADRCVQMNDDVISCDEYKDFTKKHSRNQKIRRLFNIRDERCFPPTEINKNFTIWEYDFEECVSKQLLDYDKLHTMAVQDLSGKPLIAKFIAEHSHKNNFNENFKNMMEKLISCIDALSIQNTNIIEEKNKTRKSEEEYKIKLTTITTKEQTYYKVFSCVAGFVNPEFDEPISYAYGDVPVGTDYIIKINGDSMEPDIPDGAYVAVENIEGECEQNKVYVFYYDGNSICKKYVKVSRDVIKLISINTEYPNIEVKGEIKCWGKVISGKNKKPYILKIEE